MGIWAELLVSKMKSQTLVKMQKLPLSGLKAEIKKYAIRYFSEKQGYFMGTECLTVPSYFFFSSKGVFQKFRVTQLLIFRCKYK